MPPEANPERRYDTFVIRLWRDGTAERWLRLDLEHIQATAGAVHRWRRDEADDGATEAAGHWLLRHLRETPRRPSVDEESEP